jgi:type II secretory pathway pseudopilin PulG
MLDKRMSGIRGDTMIEVLFAITIFSLVAVGGLAIMNQGTATAQRALEITLVRQEIDAQAETIRFLNSSYIAAFTPNASFAANTPAGQWQLMEQYITSPSASLASASNFGATVNGNRCPNPADLDGAFILNTRSATFVDPSGGNLGTAQTFSQAKYNGSNQLTAAEGIWIEAVRSATVLGNNQSNTGYIDFHIRACWDSPGQDVPVTLGTIVRLYEPRG